MHRDSEGNALEITPGAMNFMTAGRGIAHSERSPSHARRNGDKLFGIQSWIALPQAYEEIQPSFQHFEAANLPVVEAPGLWARTIAGSAFDQTSPVGMFSDWFYAEVMLEPGTSAPLDRDYEERAIYIVQGEIEIAGESFEAPRLLIFRPGDRITVRASSRSRLMFLGGSALEGPRYIWWNFVSSRRERIEQAKEDWKSGRFAPVPSEKSSSPSRRANGPRRDDEANSGAIPRRFRGGADLQLRSSAHHCGGNSGLRGEIRSSALSSQRIGCEAELLSGIGGKRLAHCRHHHATSGGERP